MFKIGDKVKIVGYTQVPKHLYDLYWNPDMEKVRRSDIYYI